MGSTHCLIDTYGIRVGIGLGAVLAAVGGLLKGLLATNFAAVVIGQVVLAIAQPFILNAVTALSARWFPLRERGTAAGLAALAQYLVSARKPCFAGSLVPDAWLPYPKQYRIMLLWVV